MLRWTAIVSAGNDPAWDRGWGQRSSEKPPPEAKEIILEGGLSKMNQTPVPGRVLGAGCQCTDARRPRRGSQPGDPAPPPLETVPACPARVLHAELALATLAPTRRAPEQLGSALGTTSKCPERASCVAANDGSSAPANCKGFN